MAQIRIRFILASVFMLLASFNFAFVSQAAASGGPIAPINLAQGMRGSGITILQQDLQSLGFYSYPGATGYFGPVTADALRHMQASYGLTADGVAGPISQTVMVRALLKQRLLADAYRFIGVPYAWGGVNPSQGFDCSGFIYYMFKYEGIDTIRTTVAELYTEGYTVNSDMLRKGDLVFFSTDLNGVVNHVGFYIGGSQFISATSSKGIYVQTLNSSYWGPRYMGARRVY